MNQEYKRLKGVSLSYGKLIKIKPTVQLKKNNEAHNPDIFWCPCKFCIEEVAQLIRAGRENMVKQDKK